MWDTHHSHTFSHLSSSQELYAHGYTSEAAAATTAAAAHHVLMSLLLIVRQVCAPYAQFAHWFVAALFDK